MQRSGDLRNFRRMPRGIERVGIPKLPVRKKNWPEIWVGFHLRVISSFDDVRDVCSIMGILEGIIGPLLQKYLGAYFEGTKAVIVQ